jgi:hypothetical protein
MPFQVHLQSVVVDLQASVLRSCRGLGVLSFRQIGNDRADCTAGAPNQIPVMRSYRHGRVGLHG